MGGGRAEEIVDELDDKKQNPLRILHAVCLCRARLTSTEYSHVQEPDVSIGKEKRKKGRETWTKMRTCPPPPPSLRTRDGREVPYPTSKRRREVHSMYTYHPIHKVHVDYVYT